MDILQSIYHIADTINSQMLVIKQICQDAISYQAKNVYPEKLKKISEEMKLTPLSQKLFQINKPTFLQTKKINDSSVQGQKSQQIKQQIQSISKKETKNQKKLKKSFSYKLDEKELKRTGHNDEKPKKPLSAYSLFEQKFRSQLKQSNPRKFQDSHNTEAAKKEWKKLSKDMKKPFKNEFEELMKKYKIQMKAWQGRLTNANKNLNLLNDDIQLSLSESEQK